MNSWVVRVLVITSSMLFISNAYSEDEKTKVDKARDALAKQSDDEDSSRQLEEVFQAAEKNVIE